MNRRRRVRRTCFVARAKRCFPNCPRVIRALKAKLNNGGRGGFSHTGSLLTRSSTLDRTSFVPQPPSRCVARRLLERFVLQLRIRPARRCGLPARSTIEPLRQTNRAGTIFRTLRLVPAGRFQARFCHPSDVSRNGKSAEK